MAVAVSVETGMGVAVGVSTGVGENELVGAFVDVFVGIGVLTSEAANDESELAYVTMS